MELPVLVYPKEKDEVVRRLTAMTGTFDPKTEEDVRKIIARVARDGDKALVYFSRKFDSHPITMPQALALKEDHLEAAWNQQPAELKQALQRAKMRITHFHENQRTKGFRVTEPNGNRMTQQIFPLNSVGVYVPGGLAAYPSTVLMNVLPAQVAGVHNIVLVTPPAPPSGGMEATLAAAHLCGVKTAFLVGGAQAVAALTYGTETIPKVDKVVGPGNRWVATAKRLLFGMIDIDAVAGATEVLIIADHTANPDHLAVDMIAQAEHDPDAQSILVLVGNRVKVPAIQKAIDDRMKGSSRREVIQKSLKKHGLIIRVKTAAEAVELANLRAPEHCEIIAENARELAKEVRDAGALFVGPWTPEPMGDYIMGPNHVLPTNRTARFSSPLGVHSFIKRNHIIECSRKGFEMLAPTVRILATAEGLEGHRASVEARLDSAPPAEVGNGKEVKPKPKAKPARKKVTTKKK